MQVIELESVGSTSDEVVARVQRGDPFPLAVRSRIQTAGRGRRSREWISPEGGVWLSVAIPWEGVVPGALAMHAALIAWEAVAEGIGKDRNRLSIKWPNDLLLDGKKIAGVLCEGHSRHDGGAYVVIGVGINADFVETDLPEEVRPRASTLRSLLGRRVEPDMISRRLVESIGKLDPDQHGSLDNTTRAMISERLAYLGKRVRFVRPDGTEIKGLLEGIAEDGRALTRSDDATVLVSLGEIERAAQP